MTVPIIEFVLGWKNAPDDVARNQQAKLIFDILHPQLRGFFNRLYSPSDFEDFELEVMAAVFRGLEEFRGTTDLEFYKWFNTIAFRKAVDFNRESDRNKGLFEQLSTDEIQDVLDKVARIDPPSHDLRMDLEDALRLLDISKPNCRELLWSYHGLGFKQAEIAEKLGLGAGGIHVQVRRCLDELRGLI